MKFMIVVLLALIALAVALRYNDVRQRRYRLNRRDRHLREQSEWKERQAETHRRRALADTIKQRWLTKFLWKDRRTKRLTYKPPGD